MREALDTTRSNLPRANCAAWQGGRSSPGLTAMVVSNLCSSLVHHGLSQNVAGDRQLGRRRTKHLREQVRSRYALHRSMCPRACSSPPFLLEGRQRLLTQCRRIDL
jgi:hypothetical protein